MEEKFKFKKPVLSPEQKLIVAIIKQAIRDSKLKPGINMEQDACIQSAKDFLSGGSGMLQMYLELLGIDAESGIQIINRMIKKINKPDGRHDTKHLQARNK